MADLTSENFEKEFRDNNFNFFIEKIENNFFDAKLKPPLCGSSEEKSNFLKDIAALANLNGGIIIMGFKTDKSPTNPFEKVISIEPFDTEGRVDPKKYQDVIKSGIYPEPNGIQIIYKEFNAGKHVGMIFVPQQNRTSWPFLIKYSSVDGDKYSEAVFTYVERKTDQNSVVRFTDIHKWMRDGILYDDKIKGQFDFLGSEIKKIYDRIGDPMLAGRVRVYGGFSPQTLTEQIEELKEKKMGRSHELLAYEPPDYFNFDHESGL